MHLLAIAAALAAAIPTALAQADEIEAHANAELAKQVQQAIEQNTKPEDTAEVKINAQVQELAILGGDEDYKPYQVGCPPDTVWVRPATDVSASPSRSWAAGESTNSERSAACGRDNGKS